MTTITALPDPPSRADPSNFAARGDAFLAALPTFQTEANALASEVNTHKSDAQTAASTATTQAGIATTQAGNAATSAGTATTQAGIATDAKNAILSGMGSVGITGGTINGAMSVGGTWTAAATWTLPALTLGGAVAGGGQAVTNLGTLGCGAITSSGAIGGTSLNIGTGALTAGSGTFSGDVTIGSSDGTANVALMKLGTNSPSTGATIGDLNFAARTDDTVVARIRAITGDNGNGTDGKLTFWAADNTAGAGPLTSIAELSSTGLAVTGAVSVYRPGTPYYGSMYLDVNALNFDSNENYPIYWKTGTSGVQTKMTLDASGNLTPGGDNTQTLGSGSNRWSVVYAGTGTINTSDAREKTEVRSLTEAEINASKQLSKEIGAYRWLSSVEQKSDAAREHIGLTVQRAIEIMEANNLDPMNYGFICYDKWDDVFVDHPAIEAVAAKDAVLDEDGKVIEPAVEAVEGKDAWTEKTQVAGDRYSFRMDELNLFIARGFEARLAALEAA